MRIDEFDMKIFVSVGTHERGFARLIRFVSDIKFHDVTVQFGSTETYSLNKVNFNSFDFCSFQDMTNYAINSDIIIGSASPGIAKLAWINNCVYLGVPRLHEFNEAVDDHQIDFLELVSKLGGCLQVDLDRDINKLLEEIELNVNSLLEKQRYCYDIFSERMKSVEKSVIDFFAQ